MTMEAITWPETQAAEALEALAQRSGLTRRDVAVSPSELAGGRGGAREGALESLAQSLGIEAEPVEASYAQLDEALRAAGPALFRVVGQGAPRYLAVLGSGWRGIRVLTPDQSVRTVPRATCCALLADDLETPLRDEVERLVAGTPIPQRARADAVRALLREQLAGTRAGDGWLLRLPPQASLWHQFRRAGLMRPLVGMVAAHAIQHLLWIASWWVLGRGILLGRMDSGLFAAWVLLLLTILPARLGLIWAQGRLAYGASGLLKRRLLVGALQLQDDEIRREGSGRLLGRVIESEALQALLLGGGATTLLAAVEIIVAAAVLAAGPAGGWHVAWLAVGILVVLLGGWRYYQRRSGWTALRLATTHALVEQLIGHRTRVAQERPERWHVDEDELLARYVTHGAAMDRTTALLLAPLARVWAVVAIALLAPAFMAGTVSVGSLAVGLGGILLASQALSRINGGLGILAAAAIAWKQVAPLFHAGGRLEGAGGGESGTVAATTGTPVLEADDVTFRYPRRAVPVLSGCAIAVARGEHVMLGGASGSGKSTLAKLLAGVYRPESGLLLLNGLDRHTLGFAAWRKRVATVPQFHENHILTGSLAFNLLMGRGWPPEPDDLAEAEAVCRELGLGELLDHMPGRLMQTVGDTGWQLSNGEKSRVYIGRALLGSPDLMILDESFASLDPATLARCLRTVMARAPTLMVVAHP